MLSPTRLVGSPYSALEALRPLHTTHSGNPGSAAEEGERGGYGSPGGPTAAAGTTNQHTRVGEYERGDDDCHEEGFRRACVDPWSHVRIRLTVMITR
jgi:hypothetical protein